MNICKINGVPRQALASRANGQTDRNATKPWAKINLTFRFLALAFLISLALHDAAAATSSRVALVVGNSRYLHAPQLANPGNDARLMTTTLKSVGFEVLGGIDLNASDLKLTIRQFIRALRTADVGLVFFAGHGFQADGRNYLVPVDAKLQDAQTIENETIATDALLQEMTTARPDAIRIAILTPAATIPWSRIWPRRRTPDPPRLVQDRAPVSLR